MARICRCCVGCKLVGILLVTRGTALNNIKSVHGVVCKKVDAGRGRHKNQNRNCEIYRCIYRYWYKCIYEYRRYRYGYKWLFIYNFVIAYILVYVEREGSETVHKFINDAYMLSFLYRNGDIVRYHIPKHDIIDISEQWLIKLRWLALLFVLPTRQQSKNYIFCNTFIYYLSNM